MDRLVLPGWLSFAERVVESCMRWFIKLEFILDRRGASTSIYNTDKWSKWRIGHFNTRFAVALRLFSPYSV